MSDRRKTPMTEQEAKLALIEMKLQAFLEEFLLSACRRSWLRCLSWYSSRTASSCRRSLSLAAFTTGAKLFGFGD
jgi:hypothetical protein